MNQFKKSEIAMYITGAVFLTAVGLLSGDFLTYIKMVAVFFGFIGVTYLFYKSVYFILGKLYPEKNETKTLGSIKTYTTNINFNE